MGKLLWTMLDREFIDEWRRRVGAQIDSEVKMGHGMEPKTEVLRGVLGALWALDEAIAVREKQDLEEK